MNDGKKIYEERLKEYRDISRRIAELEIKRSSNLDEIKALEDEREIVSKEIVRTKRAIDGMDMVNLGKYDEEVKSLKTELDLLYKKRVELENYDGVARAGKFIGRHCLKFMFFGSIGFIFGYADHHTTTIGLAIFLGAAVIMTMPIWFGLYIYNFTEYESLGKDINEFLKKIKIKMVSKKINIYESKFFAATDRLNDVINDNGDLYSERKRLLGEKKIGENRACLASDKIKALSEENLGIDNDISGLLERKKRLFIDLASREIDLMSMDELDEIIILDEAQTFDEKGKKRVRG